MSKYIGVLVPLMFYMFLSSADLILGRNPMPNKSDFLLIALVFAILSLHHLNPRFSSKPKD